ncbi:MAG: hypothetical protein JXA33_08790 [Anaerolineae bacterium]|nr:hypothetical protein [Anaerolineae bacterium]
MWPYRKLIILNQLSMACFVVADLAIPRMLQRMVDRGILARNEGVILQLPLHSTLHRMDFDHQGARGATPAMGKWARNFLACCPVDKL